MLILLDVDGVISNFDARYLDAHNEITGQSVRPEDLTTWNYIPSLPATATERYQIQELTHSRGFCLGLPEYPGAVDGVRRLMDEADVVFATSPFSSLYWAREREQWLEARFGACRIVSTKHKYLIKADAIVDDRTDNVTQWVKEWPNGQGVVWAREYNAGTRLARTNSWGELRTIVL